MEKEKPFKLFVPPRLSSSQVSAVKPQTIGGDTNFFKGFNKSGEDEFGLPFGITKPSKRSEHIDSDPVLQKVNFLPMIGEVRTEQSDFLEELKNPQFETSEPISRVYSKLYKEAEKIKKWKVNIEFELNQKEKKLQENRKIIEAQRKAIQELQFENEKVSLKLEDGIQENKELLKENNATRHMCNLLKETCAWSAEKSKKYEYEREETRQLYSDLNNNLEKMVQAFEELRVGAKSYRQEMHFKLKEACENIQQLEKEQTKEIHDKEKKISLLLMQNDEKEMKIKDLKLLLQEYSDKLNQFQEKMKWQNENLKESKDQQDHLMSELEEVKLSLQKSESAQKILEEELQTAGKTVMQLTRLKETQMEEISEAKVIHSSVVAKFETTISSLKELLTTEQHRLKQNEEQLKILTLELQKKSDELEDMKLCKRDKEMQLEELKGILEENQRLLNEKKHLEMITEKLQATEIELNGILQIRQKEVHDLEIKLNETATNEQNYLQQVAELKTELEQERLKSIELTENLKKLSVENKQMAQEKMTTALESKKLQEDINDSKKQEEKMMKQIENLEETKNLLRNELDAIKVELKEKNEEVETKLNKSEENARSIESEILKRDKLVKILENKFNNLKKQMENKIKSFEELQQENKALKKKSVAENKQLSTYEIKVNKLESELNDSNKKFEEMTDNYQKEIADKKISEENLLGEVEKTKAIADEAVKQQKEIDLRCQHKIAEMVALMEKHKDQYDKIVEERDAELGLYKSKEQEQSLKKISLEIEISNLKSKLSSVETQLKVETEEKEKLLREAKEDSAMLKEKKDKKIQTSVLATPETSKWKCDSKIDTSENASLNFTSVDHIQSKNKEFLWTPAKKSLSTPSIKAYTVKTPTKMKILQIEKKNPYKEGTNRKRKMLFDFDTNSDSSDQNDLLSMVSDEDKFQKLYKSYPQASHQSVATPKKNQRPLSLTTPGSALKFAAMRKMREDGWAAVSKVDRKKKIKEAEKLFT